MSILLQQPRFASTALVSSCWHLLSICLDLLEWSAIRFRSPDWEWFGRDVILSLTQWEPETRRPRSYANWGVR